MDVPSSELWILYVHDDPRAATVLRYVLGDDFNIVSACTEHDAVRMVHEKDIALVLCEQIVRGVSGIDICARLRSVRPEIERLVTITHVDRQITAAADRSEDIACHVMKPWPDPDFTNLVRAKLDSARLRRSANRSS